MIKFICTLIVAVCHCCLLAQSPVYNQFTTREGLSGNTVYCGVQDKSGFLWFGTDKGLSRFDGIRFENFGVNEGLPDPEVLELFSDSADDLWISCFKKNLSRRRKGVIETNIQNKLLAQISMESSIISIMEDDGGKKWITGKDRFVYIIEQDNITKVPFPTHVSAVFQMHGQCYAIYKEGILKLSEKGEILKTIKLDIPRHFPFNTVYGCAVSGDRLMVMAPHLMLFQYREDGFHFIEENKQLYGKLFKDSKGQCWLGSYGDGATCFQPPWKNLSNYKIYLPGKRINTIIEDNQGGFWFGTIGEGLFRLGANSAFNYNLSPEQIPVNVTALADIPEGGVYAADDRGFIYAVSNGNIRKMILPGTEKYNKARQIVRTPGGDYWIGSDKKLFRLSNGKIHMYDKPTAVKSMIYRSDTLWTATANSIYAIPEKLKEPINLGNGRSTAMCLDDENLLWTGGTNDLKCEMQHFNYNWGDRFPQLSNKIIAMAKGINGTIWAATPNDGLLRMHVKSGEVLSVESMSYHFKGALKNVQSLYAEPSGRIWIATNQGIYSIDTSCRTQYFGLQNGMTNLDANCILVVKDTLWIGTVDGLTCLPLDSSNKAPKAALMFSAVQYRAGQKLMSCSLLDSCSPESIYRIPSNAKLIAFTLSIQDYNGNYNTDFECIITSHLPPWYAVTFNNLFEWVKAGFGPWFETSLAEKGILQLGMELPAGRYTIHASARSRAGNHLSESGDLNIEKKPPWHSTVLFWCLLWGLAAVIIFRFVQERSRFRKMRMQVAELKVQALQTQINPHFIGNSVNAIQQFFYPPDAARASLYIAIFTRLLRKTMEFSEHHFIPFSEELQYVKDYLKMVQLRFEDQLKYEIMVAPGIPEDSVFPAMILQPLLENANIHGQAKEGISLIRVEFGINSDRLNCRITDNGIGLELARQTIKKVNPDHKSKGLELLHKKINTLNSLHKYDIHLEVRDMKFSTPAQRGTIAEISFNIKGHSKNAHFKYEENSRIDY